MVPDSVLKSVVTAASGYVDPDQESTPFAQFGPTRMADPLKESHVEKTKEQQEDRYTGLAQP
jgi:hypothetical protein